MVTAWGGPGRRGAEPRKLLLRGCARDGGQLFDIVSAVDRQEKPSAAASSASVHGATPCVSSGSGGSAARRVRLQARRGGADESTAPCTKRPGGGEPVQSEPG